MWILPTYSRPEQCAEVLQTLKRHGTTTKGVVFVNAEIPAARLRYVNEAGPWLPVGWRMTFSENNLGALGAMDAVFKRFPDEDFYGFIADDEFVRTNGWDAKLVNLAGRWDVAHGVDDLHGGRRAQGGLCIGGDLARAVGYLTIPETWHHFGLDDLWESLARGGAYECHVARDVNVEHWHHANGKAPHDECYALGNKWRDYDFQVFCNWLRHKRGPTVERVRTAREAGR